MHPFLLLQPGPPLAEERRLSERAGQHPEEERIRYYKAELLNMKAYVDSVLRDHAARVQAPTLVLHGSEDLVVPPGWGRELAAAIHAAKFELVGGATTVCISRTGPSGNGSSHSSKRAPEAGLR